MLNKLNFRICKFWFELEASRSEVFFGNCSAPISKRRWNMVLCRIHVEGRYTDHYNSPNVSCIIGIFFMLELRKGAASLSLLSINLILCNKGWGKQITNKKRNLPQNTTKFTNAPTGTERSSFLNLDIARLIYHRAHLPRILITRRGVGEEVAKYSFRRSLLICAHGLFVNLHDVAAAWFTDALPLAYEQTWWNCAMSDGDLDGEPIHLLKVWGSCRVKISCFGYYLYLRNELLVFTEYHPWYFRLVAKFLA